MCSARVERDALVRSRSQLVGGRCHTPWPIRACRHRSELVADGHPVARGSSTTSAITSGFRQRMKWSLSTRRTSSRCEVAHERISGPTASSIRPSSTVVGTVRHASATGGASIASSAMGRRRCSCRWATTSLGRVVASPSVSHQPSSRTQVHVADDATAVRPADKHDRRCGGGDGHFDSGDVVGASR